MFQVLNEVLNDVALIKEVKDRRTPHSSSLQANLYNLNKRKTLFIIFEVQIALDLSKNVFKTVKIVFLWENFGQNFIHLALDCKDSSFSTIFKAF